MFIETCCHELQWMILKKSISWSQTKIFKLSMGRIFPSLMINCGKIIGSFDSEAFKGLMKKYLESKGKRWYISRSSQVRGKSNSCGHTLCKTSQNNHNTSNPNFKIPAADHTIEPDITCNKLQIQVPHLVQCLGHVLTISFIIGRKIKYSASLPFSYIKRHSELTWLYL